MVFTWIVVFVVIGGYKRLKKEVAVMDRLCNVCRVEEDVGGVSKWMSSHGGLLF